MSVVCWLNQYQTVIVLCAAIGTMSAAFFACRSAKHARNSVKATSYQGILGLRYSSEMLSSRKRLHDWKRLQENGKKEFTAEFIGLLETNEGAKINEARRYVKSYFEPVAS
jgi:hypothetical protein